MTERVAVGPELHHEPDCGLDIGYAGNFPDVGDGGVVQNARESFFCLRSPTVVTLVSTARRPIKIEGARETLSENRHLIK